MKIAGEHSTRGIHAQTTVPLPLFHVWLGTVLWTFQVPPTSACRCWNSRTLVHCFRNYSCWSRESNANNALPSYCHQGCAKSSAYLSHPQQFLSRRRWNLELGSTPGCPKRKIELSPGNLAIPVCQQRTRIPYHPRKAIGTRDVHFFESLNPQMFLFKSLLWGDCKFRR